MDASSEPQQRDALAEGRRIYLGNLLYSVQPADVEDMLRQAGFADSFEKLHISIDPVSGRNPGYCFAEFTTREEADRALEALPGASIFNRALKVGPCHPKTQSQSRSGWGAGSRDGNRSDVRGGDDSGGYNPTFQRWGDWKGDKENSKAAGDAEQGPYAARRHLDARSQRPTDKAQLYIGGLGMMTNQEQHDAEMQEILQGFE
jgi:RNA recognition motif-containing protein